MDFQRKDQRGLVLVEKSSSENKKNLTVKCPRCQKEFNYYSQESRPFCSVRCRQIDLGRWLDGEYKVPVVDTSDISDSEDSEEGGEEQP